MHIDFWPHEELVSIMHTKLILICITGTVAQLVYTIVLEANEFPTELAV